MTHGEHKQMQHNVIFQDRDRPQGNIDKQGYRVPKSNPIVFFLEFSEVLKSSLDALDGLYRPE